MSDDGSKTQLAIIKNVRLGMNDESVVLTFETYITESVAALQALSWDDAKAMIEAFNVKHVDDLNGKPCWVTVTNGGWGGTILYRKAAVI